MSGYLSKLSSIAEKKQKLLEEESILIEKRKSEIAGLAEKFGLLTLSDTVLAGLFVELQSAIQDKSEKLKTWEQQGAQFLKPKPNRKAAEKSAA